MLQRTMLPALLGLAAVAAAPSVAQADPDGCGRTVYVYDGYDTYRAPRRTRSRTRHAPPTRRVYTPPAPTVPVADTRCLLPAHVARGVARHLRRERWDPRAQLRLLRQVTDANLVTMEQVQCLVPNVTTSRARFRALVMLYTALDKRCCVDYVGQTQYLLDHCDREAYACRIAELKPPCSHHGNARHGTARQGDVGHARHGTARQRGIPRAEPYPNRRWRRGRHRG
jgi:hypothetical protein